MATFAEFTAKKKQQKKQNETTGRTFAEFTAQRKGLTSKEESADSALSSPATVREKETVAPLSGGKKFVPTDVVGKHQATHGDNAILSQDPRYKMRFTNVELEQKKREAADDAIDELLGRQQAAQREMGFFDSGEFNGPQYLAAEQIYNQIHQQIAEENRKAMSQQQIDEIKAFQEMERWQSATGRKGFADASAYAKNDDLKYNVINRDPEAVAKSHEEAAKYNLDIAGVDMGHLEQMTDEEISLYNYYYSTVGKEKADEYLASIESDLKARRMGDRREWYREYAEKNPVAASAFSVLTSPVRGLSYVGQAADFLKNGKMDANESYNIFTRAGSDTRGQVSSDIEKNVEGFWGKAGSFAYNTGMSMGDFLMAAGLSGGVGGIATTIMGTGAAAQTVLDAKDRGLNDDQAFALGTIAGFAEAATEKFSIEALLDRAAMGKGALTYILKNAITEGSEEAASGIINTVADVLISKDKSEWAQSVEDYKAQGMSDKEAFWRAVADQAKSIGLDALGGMLSGGLIGSVGAIGNTAAQQAAQPKKGAEVATEMGIGKHGAEAAEKAGITPENVGAFTANYEAGKDGKAFEEVKTVQTGIDENVARQAYNAGQMDAIDNAVQTADNGVEQEAIENEEERNESGREGSERQIGVAAAERSGGIPEGTGSAAERREAQRLRAEEIRNSVNAAGQVNTSAAAQGIAEGTSKQSFKLVPAKLWTNEVRTAVHDLAKKGIQGIPIVGELEMVDENGPYMARAAISRDGKRVWFSLDDPDVEFERLIEHEEYHFASIKDPGLVEKTRQSVISKYDEETLAKVVELYVDTYGWGNLSKEYILGEIFGDANGAINEFEDYNLAGATLFTDVVRNVVRNADTQIAATVDSAKAKFKGYDAKTGKGIYESNFPKGTPKAAKAQRILNYIQNVWSKKPIRLVVEKPGEAPREIMARFDPTYDQGQNIPTDASKLMGGNRHGNASEQRVTLDLADDYYQIASESGYNGFKEETGKDSPTHDNVKEWHYFVNDILFQEYGETETAPYRVTINVKERSDGSFVYSFNAEREDKRPSTRRTLHADVNQTATSGEANAQPSTDIVDQGGENVNTQTSRAPSKAQLEKAVAQYIEKYGAIEPGENPFRTVQVPKKTSDTEKVSKTIRTIMEAGVTPDAVIPKLEELVAEGEFSYETITDKQAIADAQAKIAEAGWEMAKDDWKKDAQKGAISKDHTVTGWALYNYAVTKGKLTEAVSIIQTMVGNQRNAAQALQATRVLKKMSPDAQLYGIQQSIERMQKEINERYQKRFKKGKAPELKVDEALYAKFLEAKTDKARSEVMGEIYSDIGRQMPSSFRDKANAWRYLAMLGNPRTHVRNIFGNAFFAPVVAAKNLTATGIEKAVNAVSGGKVGRSKAIVTGATKLDRALLSAAWGDFANVQGEIMSGGKYSDFQMANDAVEKGRSIYKNNGEWGKRADSKAAAKVVRKVTDVAWKIPETLRKKNSDLLDREDAWFSQPHYAAALASYCKANGITPETIVKGKSIDVARKYAIREAQKATYRDASVFSNLLGNIKASEKHVVGKAANILIEGIMPFKKTPANILARGLEYSPLGLLKAITVDLVRVHNGDISGAEMIDNLSAGLTGSGLLALGAYLTAQGLIRGAGSGDDKENQFEELMGHQAYSLEIGGKSYTLDWLAPESIPFFVGANIVERMREQGEALSMALIMDTIGQISDPMLEMSCIQGINDALETIAYAKNEGKSAVSALLSESITSYITQYVPTLWGQIERTSQDRSYSTFTRKNEFLTSDQQYLIGSISARFPGDFQQIPYIDAWGRQELTGNVAQRAANNFLNPAYVSDIKTSGMEEELLRLYEATDAGSVFPTKASKSFPLNGETKYLTADEYVKYATQKGQVSYELVSNLVNTQTYKNMSDEDKAKAISEAYSFANVVAKKSVSNYTIKGWEEKAIAARKSVGISYAKYLEARVSVMGIKSLKDENGETIDNSESLLKMEAIYKIPGLTDAQRAQLFEDFDIGKKVRGKNKAAVQEALEKMR